MYPPCALRGQDECLIGLVFIISYTSIDIDAPAPDSLHDYRVSWPYFDELFRGISPHSISSYSYLVLAGRNTYIPHLLNGSPSLP